MRQNVSQKHHCSLTKESMYSWIENVFLAVATDAATKVRARVAARRCRGCTGVDAGGSEEWLGIGGAAADSESLSCLKRFCGGWSASPSRPNAARTWKNYQSLLLSRIGLLKCLKLTWNNCFVLQNDFFVRKNVKHMSLPKHFVFHNKAQCGQIEKSRTKVIFQN